MNLFDLQAVLTLDSSDYENGLNQAEETASSGGSRIGNALSNIGKVTAVAMTAAVAGVTSLTKSAVEGYADYEQLVGGVETLFEESSDLMMAYAEDSYRTVGISTNEYMETVTSFAAALTSSVTAAGGSMDEAVEYADTAMVDMADNANKMGTSMESIQNAYQGFAKQNYTMLDNLKLGYGGTKEEMERLIADANALREEQGLTADLTIDSYADIITAIHEVQTEMGITGTTAKEASSTISGSLSAMQSAWQNVLVGMADENADFGQLINNLVESAGTFAENIIPRIEQAIMGIGDLITNLAPVVVERLPGLVENILPSIIEAAYSLITAFVEIVPELLTMIIDTVLNNVSALVDMIVDIVTTLADALIEALPILLEKAPEVILKFATAIIENLPKIVEAGISLVNSLIEGIGKMYAKIIEIGANLVSKAYEGFKSKISEAKQWGKDLIQNFIDGITAKWQALKTKVSNVAQTVKDFLGFSEPKEGPLSNFHTYAPDMMKLYAQGMTDNIGLVEKASEKVAGAVGLGNAETEPAPGTKQNLEFNGTIVVQSVLDGKIIGESTYKYLQGRNMRYAT